MWTNRAARPVAPPAQEAPRSEEGAGQVGADQPSPLRERHVAHLDAGHVEPRRIDQHLDLAERRLYRSERRLDRGLVVDRALPDDRLAARRDDARGDRARACFVRMIENRDTIAISPNATAQAAPIPDSPPVTATERCANPNSSRPRNEPVRAWLRYFAIASSLAVSTAATAALSPEMSGAWPCASTRKRLPNITL